MRLNLNKIKAQAVAGKSKAQRMMANYYWNKGQYATSLDWFNSLVRNKKTPVRQKGWAYECLGWMYYYGKGVEKNFRLSQKNYKITNSILHELAMKGNVIAQRKVGENHGSGIGARRNLKRAFFYYLMAAKKGSPVCQPRVARAYEKGIGVKRNYRLAFDWYLKSAKRGNADSQYMVGRR